MENIKYEITAKGTLVTFGGRLSPERIKLMIQLAFENDMIDNIEVEVKEIGRTS